MPMPMPPTGLVRSDDIPWIDFPPGMGGGEPIAATPDGLTIRLTLQPGDGFNFHFHHGHDEVVYILEGHGEAWVEQEQTTVAPGDIMVLPKRTVHALFNTSGSRLVALVVLSPLIGTYEEDNEVLPGLGWGLQDVSGEEPWASLR